LFKFIPGQKISWEQVNTSNSIEDNSKFEWIVGLDINNQTYLYSAKTNSYAYFLANEEELVFTSYIGSKSDSLYWFYLSSFRLIFGYYKGVNVEDDLSVSISQAKIFKLLQDFIAPFYIFIKPKFRMQYISRKRSINDSEIVLKSEFKDIVMGKVLRKIKAEFNIESTGTFVWKLDIDGVLYEFKRLRN
jgi:hypothetical protein